MNNKCGNSRIITSLDNLVEFLAVIYICYQNSSCFHAPFKFLQTCVVHSNFTDIYMNILSFCNKKVPTYMLQYLLYLILLVVLYNLQLVYLTQLCNYKLNCFSFIQLINEPFWFLGFFHRYIQGDLYLLAIQSSICPYLLCLLVCILQHDDNILSQLQLWLPRTTWLIMRKVISLSSTLPVRFFSLKDKRKHEYGNQKRCCFKFSVVSFTLNMTNICMSNTYFGIQSIHMTLIFKTKTWKVAVIMNGFSVRWKLYVRKCYLV